MIPPIPDAPAPATPDLLVVDDTAANLRLLTRLLTGFGYRVRPVTSGEAALQAARAEPPDVVLLDVDMPEMDGYEVCRRFKADPALAEIPVLFLSALGETEDKLAAFAAGGVDYVTKPFHVDELRARISTHLELRRLRLELEGRNRELDESYRRLREVQQLRHDLIHMVAHDMRSPMMGISGYLELLELEGDQLGEEHREFVARALDAARALVRQLDAMLDADRLETDRLPLRLGLHDLAGLADRAIRSFGPIAAQRVVWSGERQAARVSCDPELVVRVIANLLANALAYSDERDVVEVGWGRASRPGRARFEVRDRGPGIPEELRDKVFEKYVTKGTSRGRTRSMGLGLAFCKLAVVAHGGAIDFDSPASSGTIFWFELPQEGPGAESGG
jgi:two-component system sensor histidine kinase/response regulator